MARWRFDTLNIFLAYYGRDTAGRAPHLIPVASPEECGPGHMLLAPFATARELDPKVLKEEGAFFQTRLYRITQ